MVHDLTQTLNSLASKPVEKAAVKLMPLVYDDLRHMAAQLLAVERKNHTLQPTALVHEAFLKLVDQSRVDWRGRTHFLAVGAEAMRRILIDHARTKKRGKRGGGWRRVLLEPALAVTETGEVEVESLHAAMEALAGLDPLQARIVELRFLGGLTVEEVAHVLGVSKRKVEGDWTHAKAWLRARLADTRA
jgi:RNA polymerase sigma factor (TIGR02999 family)